MAWHLHWIKTPNAEDLVPPLVVHVANPSCAYLRWVGLQQKNTQRFLTTKQGTLLFTNGRGGSVAAHSLEVHFSTSLHHPTPRKTPTSCDGENLGPPMLIWLASVTSLICVRTLWFCSSTGHFRAEMLRTWMKLLGGISCKQFDFFVYVSFVSLMLWHCIHLSKQPPSKGLKWFWVSRTLVFLHQVFQEVLQQRKLILYKSATSGSPMLISTCDWRMKEVFPTKHLGHLGAPLIPPQTKAPALKVSHQWGRHDPKPVRATRICWLHWLKDSQK